MTIHRLNVLIDTKKNQFLPLRLSFLYSEHGAKCQNSKKNVVTPIQNSIEQKPSACHACTVWRPKINNFYSTELDALGINMNAISYWKLIQFIAVKVLVKLIALKCMNNKSNNNARTTKATATIMITLKKMMKSSLIFSGFFEIDGSMDTTAPRT